jgi:hypothetical protein
MFYLNMKSPKKIFKYIILVLSNDKIKTEKSKAISFKIVQGPNGTFKRFWSIKKLEISKI